LAAQQLIALFGSLTDWQLSLLRWLGVPKEWATPAARVELVWTNFPVSWQLFLLLGCLAGVFYGIVALYRREQAGCPAWMKMLLATLRCMVVLLITVILLNPTLVQVQTRTVQPSIVIARDISASMATADVELNRVPTTSNSLASTKAVTRIQAINDIFSANHRQLLLALERKGRIQLLDFAEHTQAVEWPELHSSAEYPPPLTTAHGGTNVAEAIEQGMQTERPAAIVLLTDGQHTAKDDVFQAARKANLHGVPLYFVGLGNPARPRGEFVAKVFARPQAWQDEPFEIDAVVSFQSAPAGTRLVELLEERVQDDNQPTGDSRVVATANVEVPESGTGQATVHFSHAASAAGRYVYRASMASSSVDQDDTKRQASSEIVHVLSRQLIRVLLVAGGPSWDYRLLQMLLTRDKTIDVSCWLQSLDEGRGQEGKRPITHLPRTRAELFAYDVVLLLDPNPQELDASWIDLLRQFVGEHSGGLLFMAGPQFSASLLAGTETAELATLLPVKLGDLAALDIESLVTTNQQTKPMHLVTANADHPLLRFHADAAESLLRWNSLPGVLWSLPASGSTPTSTVLIEQGDSGGRGLREPRPLLVAGRYGSGNTLYLGFNGTWRWRSVGRQAEFFDKFWIQAIRFLVEGRSQENRRRGYVQTDRERYEVGDRIVVSARLLDAEFRPLDLPGVAADVTVAGSILEQVRLTSVADQPGRFEGVFAARQPGSCTIGIHLPDAGEMDSIQSTFLIDLPSLETSQTWLNRSQLVELASLSGGRYFDLNEVDGLAAEVPNRTETIEERGPPRPLWDSPVMLILLVGLLSTEWFLRRRYSLQ
jgi:hypothetical protein